VADKDEAIKLLRSIDSSLKQLLRQSAQAIPATVADDRDLDGKWGDPQVKFLPRDWTGDDYKNYRFSECPPALLDMLADAFDYFARKAEESGETYNGKPTAPYKRKNAARARGWAKRLRNGYKATAVDRQTGELLDEPAGEPAPMGGSEWPAEDEIPF
jgi:hypothetical protein